MNSIADPKGNDLHATLYSYRYSYLQINLQHSHNPSHHVCQVGIRIFLLKLTELRIESMSDSLEVDSVAPQGGCF